MYLISTLQLIKHLPAFLFLFYEMFAWALILECRGLFSSLSAIFAVKTMGFDEIKTIKAYTSSFYYDDFMIVYQ